MLLRLCAVKINKRHSALQTKRRPPKLFIFRHLAWAVNCFSVWFKLVKWWQISYSKRTKSSVFVAPFYFRKLTLLGMFSRGLQSYVKLSIFNHLVFNFALKFGSRQLWVISKGCGFASRSRAIFRHSRFEQHPMKLSKRLLLCLKLCILPLSGDNQDKANNVEDKQLFALFIRAMSFSLQELKGNLLIECASN